MFTLHYFRPSVLKAQVLHLSDSFLRERKVNCDNVTSQASPRSFLRFPLGLLYSSQLLQTFLIFPFGFEHIDLIFLM